MNIPTTFATERFKRFSETDIKRVLLGRTVGDEAHWSYHLDPDGRAESMELGNTKQDVWCLSRGELCFKDHGKPVTDCYEIWMSGKDVRFLRDGVLIVEGILLNE